MRQIIGVLTIVSIAALGSTSAWAIQKAGAKPATEKETPSPSEAPKKPEAPVQEIEIPTLSLEAKQESIDQLKKLETLLNSKFPVKPGVNENVTEALLQSRLIDLFVERDWAVSDPRQVITLMSTQMFMQNSITLILSQDLLEGQGPMALVKEIIRLNQKILEAELLAASPSKEVISKNDLRNLKIDRKNATQLIYFLSASRPGMVEFARTALTQLNEAASSAGVKEATDFSQKYLLILKDIKFEKAPPVEEDRPQLRQSLPPSRQPEKKGTTFI